MKSTRLLIVLAAAAVLWFAASGSSQLFQANPTVLAAVSVEEVWLNIDDREEMVAEMKGRREEVLREQEKRAKDIKNLEQDLEWLPAGSDDQKKKQAEVEEAAWNYQAWLKYQENMLLREEKNRYELLYRKTLDAVSEVAEANGIDIVIFKEKELPSFKRLTKAAQVLALIGNRKVLYCRDELDITDLVITRMNNQNK